MTQSFYSTSPHNTKNFAVNDGQLNIACQHVQLSKSPIKSALLDSKAAQIQIDKGNLPAVYNAANDRLLINRDPRDGSCFFMLC